MNHFTLETIKQLIEQALTEPLTENSWLDNRYAEQPKWQGHQQPYYKLFYLIAQVLKPELVVELGSYQGTSAAHFACGNPLGEVITIDIHREDKVAQQMCYEVEENCPNVTYINMWIKDAVSLVSQLDKKIEILFEDAWHDYEHTKQNWDLYSPLLADRALVIVDDLTDNGGVFEGMERFWAELPYEKFTDTRLHHGIPIGFALFERVKEDVEQDIVEQSVIRKRGRPKKGDNL